MATIEIRHAVSDYATWKRAFDSDPLGRAKNGVVRHTVYRPADDPNYIVVTLDFETRERAQQFVPALRKLWSRVGSQLGFGGDDGVQVRVLDEVERIEY